MTDSHTLGTPLHLQPARSRYLGGGQSVPVQQDGSTFHPPAARIFPTPMLGFELEPTAPTAQQKDESDLPDGVVPQQPGPEQDPTPPQAA